MPTGFFGKIPASGDFVSRGLAPGVRPLLDRWLTLHLADAARTPDLWPDTGLHALIDGPTGALALFILPGHDTSGRAFPLAACCAGVATDQTGLEAWVQALRPALQAALDTSLSPDALADQIKALPDPAASDTPLIPPLLWTDHPPAAPAQAIPQIFGQTHAT